MAGLHSSPGSGSAALSAAAAARRREARAGIRLCAFLASLLLLGCGVTRGSAPPDLTSEEQREYSQALSLLGADRAAGMEALEAFVDDHPRSRLADDASFRLAELALEDGREGDALQHLSWVMRRHPKGDRSDEARIEFARLQWARGHPASAYRTARDIRLSLLEGDKRRQAHRLLADLAAENGKTADQLRWLSKVRADQADEEAAARIDGEIEQVLATMSPEELEEAAEQLGKRVPAARVRLRQAEIALYAGNSAGAEAALAQASALPLAPEDVFRLTNLENALRGGLGPRPGLLAEVPGIEGLQVAGLPDLRATSGTLGVVLPLSGSFAAYGEESLLGVLLAAEAFQPPGSSAGARIRVLVRDSGGRAATAARGVRSLAREPDLLAVVGPLLAEEAEAAAEAAEDEAVPLITLTRREEVARHRPHVIRLGSSPRLEAELVADYALRELGIRRFAILYPRDSYGSALRGAFWDAVEVGGGSVVGVASYDPEATDFAEPIRHIIGYEFLSGAEREALGERKKLLKRANRMAPERAAELREEAAELTGPGGAPLPPFVDFDALFIPDSHENASLIAPHLAFHEVRGVRLLGTSGWNHTDLVKIGGKHVNGAIFTGDFHPQSSYPFVSEFVRRFRQTFGEEPSFLSAQGFDAASLVMVQIARGWQTREQVAKGLLATRAYPGVSGVTNVRPDGNAVKRPYLLGVSRGQIVSVDEIGEPPFLQVPDRDSPENSDAGEVQLR
jgi:ABC-type branched-subunit amino acid transport system substrate-binding protein